MKTNLIISLFLLSLKAFALPGDMSLENFHTDVGCVDTGLSSLEKNLEAMMGATCRDFAETQAKDFCECHEKLYPGLSDNDDFKDFNERIAEFDAQTAAKYELMHEPHFLKNAATINLIANEYGLAKNPFGEGGACFNQFNQFQNKLAQSTGVNSDNESFLSELSSVNDFEVLDNKFGISGESIRSDLDNFFYVRTMETGGRAIEVFEGTEEKTRIFEYLENYGRESGQNQRLKYFDNRNAYSENQRLSVPPIDVINSICSNMVDELQAKLTEVKEEKITGNIIDRESLLTQKVLNDLDIRAYNGLKDSYTRYNEDDRHSAFFGESFCSRYSPITDDDLKLTDTQAQAMKSLTDTELRVQLTEANSLIDKYTLDYELGLSLVEKHDEAREPTEARVKDLLEEFNLDMADFKRLITNREEGDDAFKILRDLFGEDINEEVTRGPAFQALLQSTIEYIMLTEASEAEYVELGKLAEILSHQVTLRDNLFREAHSRVDNLEQAEQFFGYDNIFSVATKYYLVAEEQANAVLIGPARSQYTGTSGSLSHAVERTEQGELLANSMVDRIRNREVTSGDASFDELATEAIETIADPTRNRTRSDYLAGGRSYSEVAPARRREGMAREAQRQINTMLAESGVDRNLGDGEVASAPLATGSGSAASLPIPLTDYRTGFGDYNQEYSPVIAESPVIRDTPAGRDFAANKAARESLESSYERIANRVKELQGNGEEEGLVDAKTRAELEALQAQLEILEKENELLLKKQKERIAQLEREAQSKREKPSIDSSAVKPPLLPKNNLNRRSVSGQGSSRVAAPVATAAPVSSGGGIQGSSDFRAPRQGETGRSSSTAAASLTTASPSIATEESGGGIRLTLVNSDVGFAIMKENENHNIDKSVDVNFLQMSDVEKAAFIERYFENQDDSTAYIKQSDGRIIMIEKNKKLAETPEGKQAGVIHRLHSLNSILNTIDSP